MSLARLLDQAVQNNDEVPAKRLRMTQQNIDAAQPPTTEEESFDLDYFFTVTPAQTAAGTAAVVPSALTSNLTMVSFEAKSDGQVICNDALFVAEVEFRAGAEFASTKAPMVRLSFHSQVTEMFN